MTQLIHPHSLEQSKKDYNKKEFVILDWVGILRLGKVKVL
jgi:hypothetical protein